MPSVPTVPPPDDSGTDAFRRFGYQAHVVFPSCLRLYFVGDIVAIYCEHWEDVLIEFIDRLVFIQIKTRDPGRGPWRYRHLLDEGGALRSLLRTHRAVANIEENRAIEYEIVLEGSVDTADGITRLLVDGPGANESMCDTCADRLGIAPDEARALLERVTVRDASPARFVIAATHRDILRLQGGHLPAHELSEIYDRAIELIRRAMEADLLSDDWPTVVMAPRTRDDALEMRAAAKRIDRERLEPIFSRLEHIGPRLLEVIEDQERLRATALERKLQLAGASDVLIGRAKQFRAQATIRVAEARGASVFDVEALIADLHLRLQSVADSVAETVSSATPAAEIWDRLEERLSANPSAYDPSRLLGQDHILLLGQICQLSDECKFRWGGVDA